MSEKQIPLFTEIPIDVKEEAPPVGSKWTNISEWVDTLKDLPAPLQRTDLATFIFNVLNCGGGEITNKFIRHMIWCMKVFDRKQQNYGPENIAKLGENGIMSRVADDKFSRLKTLANSPDGELEGEPALDAWHDSCVYGALGAMVHVGDWPTCEELGMNTKSLEQICHEAIEGVAGGTGMTPADALKYIEENLPK